MKKTKGINVLNYSLYKSAFNFFVKGTFIFIVFFLPKIIFAQYFEDSIKYSLKQKPKPIVKLDSKNAFITNLSVRTISVKAGIEFNKTIQFGVGYNWLNTSIKREFILQSDTILSYLKYQYFSPFINYTFYKSKKWVFAIPVQFGIGKTFYEYSTLDSKSNKLYNSVILTYEPAITAEYKPVKYVGVGLGIGYRFAFYNELKKHESFTTPLWIFIGKIYFGEIYREVFPKKKKSKSN
jgi:hypothetical protein